MSALTASGTTLRSTLINGAIGGLIAAVANVIVYLLATSVFAVEILIPQPPDMTTMGPLPLPFVIFASFLPGLAAAGLLTVLKGNKRTFIIIAAVVLVLSMFPLLTTGMAAPTAIVLGIMHVVAAAAITYMLALRG
ncbi:MAG: hypothetical protein KME04_09975 [Pleurocapsa minor GSE-CHR-MK-17-07R]|jgi:hypothetical protein|nr:hypothetical protein [Pleurocapsa minor GSE-CHR-MK 17-07R]